MIGPALILARPGTQTCPDCVSATIIKRGGGSEQTKPHLPVPLSTIYYPHPHSGYHGESQVLQGADAKMKQVQKVP